MAKNLHQQLMDLVGKPVAISSKIFIMGQLNCLASWEMFKIRVDGNSGYAWVHFSADTVEKITHNTDVPYIWLKE